MATYETGYGWTASSDPSDWGGNTTVDVYGSKFRVRGDLVIGSKDKILADAWRWLLFSYNRRVERLSLYAAGDEWSYFFRANKNNPNSISEHGGAMACDLNAVRHPNQASSKYVGFTKAQVAVIDDLLAECENIFDWGGNWHSTIDPMHWDVISPTDAHKAKIKRVVTKLRAVMAADPTNYGLAVEPPVVPPVVPPVTPVVVKTTVDLSNLLAAIKKGDKSSLVEQLQTALKAHGFPCSVDGYWGSETKAAASKAQVKLCGATPGTSGADGVPGKQSLTALGFTVVA